MVNDMEWRPGVTENLGYYVYLLIDPRDDRVFYVGKGTGDRCFSHISEARTTTRDTKGDYEKLATIRGIEESGDEVQIEILRHALTEAEAFHIESAVIELLGFSDLTNRVVGVGTHRTGRMSVADVNAQYGAEPVEIDPNHKVVLIRITWRYSKGIGEDDLYEATRKWWRVNPKRGAEHAMAVHGGVVRAVYKINKWRYANDEDVAVDPGSEGRWAFDGQIDHEMEDRYLYGEVTRYLALGAQNPIRYVNC